MANIHAVLGPGGDKVPASVIQDGLKDLLKKGDSVALPWYGGPVSASLEAAYDYIVENEIPFTMFYSGRKPPVPFEVDHGELAETKNIQKSLAQMASPGSNLLVLFPDGDEDLSEEIFGFLDFAPGGVTTLDLTNGLVPIKVNDEEEPHSEEEKVAEAAETEEDSLDGFTREELEGLGLKLLKRAAANIAPGVTIDSKEQAISLILGEPSPESLEVEEGNQEEPQTEVIPVVRPEPGVDVAELKKLVATMSEQLAKLESLLQ